jgi:hypothetical protein
MSLILSLPMWAFLIVTIVIIFAALEAGRVFGARRHKGGDAEKHELGSLGPAMLGLLGFILAITFGSQLSRFETGKRLLLEEANAIHATWLRAGMMPEPYQREARSILRKYVGVRADRDRDLVQRIAESEAMQSQLWEICVAGTAEMDEAFPTELLLDTANRLISLHEQRVTVSKMQNMPAAFWAVLLALTVLTFGLAGYEAGVARGSRTAAGPIAVVGFSVLVMLIADLDAPGKGALRFDQHALNYVAMRMDTHEEHIR